MFWTRPKVLFIAHGEHSFSAVCLNWYVVSQGTTLRQAQDNIRAALCAQAFSNIDLGKRAFQDVPKAPDVYWQAWNVAIPLEPLTQREDLSERLASLLNSIRNQLFILPGQLRIADEAPAF